MVRKVKQVKRLRLISKPLFEMDTAKKEKQALAAKARVSR
jgi:hypothetical protein